MAKYNKHQFTDLLKRFLKKYPIISATLSIISFITILLSITAVKLTSTTEVEILYTPASANLTINGKPYKNGNQRLPNTEVDVVIEKDGFITQTFKFDAARNAKLYVYLLQEDGTYSWYENNPEDALLLNSIGGALARESSDAYLKNYPIMEILPIIYANYDEDFNYTEFRIDGGHFDECPVDFCIKITDTTGGNQEAALKLISEKGYEAKKYRIIYEYKPIKPLN